MVTFRQERGFPDSERAVGMRPPLARSSCSACLSWWSWSLPVMRL